MLRMVLVGSGLVLSCVMIVIVVCVVVLKLCVLWLCVISDIVIVGRLRKCFFIVVEIVLE